MTEPIEAQNDHGDGQSASRLVTLPNILSLSRLVLLPIILVFLFRREGLAAVGVMAVSWLTDAFDGIAARRLHLVSNLGRALDHIVDKIWIATVLVVLVWLRGLPLYIAGAVILRDILILAGSVAIMRSRGTFVSSDIVGKITGFAFALLIVYYTLDLPALAQYRSPANIVVAVLIAVSFVNYTYVFLRRMTRLRLPGEETAAENGERPR
ncbi:MAG: CDP-alcohol phosphatidyltransferase family protein [bacterium]